MNHCTNTLVGKSLLKLVAMDTKDRENVVIAGQIILS